MAALTLPTNAYLMNDEEMTYLEGGVAVPVVIGLIVSIGTFTYSSGYAVGKRVAYMGSKKEMSSFYRKNKWTIRSGVLAVAPAAGIALLGFENGFYDTLASRK